MEDKKILQLRDSLTVCQYGYIREIISIDRVTDKTAFSGTRKFKREISCHGYVREIGAATWGPSFHVTTNNDIKLTEKYEAENVLKRLIDRIDYKKISLEKIKQIIDLLK